MYVVTQTSHSGNSERPMMRQLSRDRLVWPKSSYDGALFHYTTQSFTILQIREKHHTTSALAEDTPLKLSLPSADPPLSELVSPSSVLPRLRPLADGPVPTAAERALAIVTSMHQWRSGSGRDGMITHVDGYGRHGLLLQCCEFHFDRLFFFSGQLGHEGFIDFLCEKGESAFAGLADARRTQDDIPSERQPLPLRDP
jgi:hypothetical protein